MNMIFKSRFVVEKMWYHALQHASLDKDRPPQLQRYGMIIVGMC